MAGRSGGEGLVSRQDFGILHPRPDCKPGRKQCGYGDMEIVSGFLHGPEEAGFWSLFLQAGMVVKLVLIGLVLASVWCWAVILEKYLTLRRVHRQADRFEQLLWSEHSLEQLYENFSQDASHPMEVLFVSGVREWRDLQRRGLSSRETWESMERHIEKVMSVAAARETEPLQKNLLSLATIGSTAPFVGLFGTVWGIMNSFQAIAVSSDTSLAVVAPGIAEALFATALGLFVAIPAVIFYNRFNADVSDYASRMEIFCDELTAFLLREDVLREDVQDRGA